MLTGTCSPGANERNFLAYALFEDVELLPSETGDDTAFFVGNRGRWGHETCLGAEHLNRPILRASG